MLTEGLEYNLQQQMSYHIYLAILPPLFTVYPFYSNKKKEYVQVATHFGKWRLIIYIIKVSDNGSSCFRILQILLAVFRFCLRNIKRC